MVKLGLPISRATTTEDHDIVADYFPDIDAEIGDNQSLLSGESTLMARLNSLSSLIEKSSVESKCKSNTFVVLIDYKIRISYCLLS